MTERQEMARANEALVASVREAAQQVATAPAQHTNKPQKQRQRKDVLPADLKDDPLRDSFLVRWSHT